MAECYTECLDHVTTLTENYPCDIDAINKTDFFTSAMQNDQCGSLPSWAVEAVATFRFREKCYKFAPPELLWVHNDKTPASVGIRGSSEDACEAAGSRGTAVKRIGVTPSGTTCSCPRTYLRSYQTTTELRGSKDNDFVDPGLGAIPNLIYRQSRGVATGSARYVVMRWITLTAAVTARLQSPMQWFSTARGVYAAGKEILSWSCSQSVGAWPLRPSSVRTEKSGRACRASDSAKSGGSRVWMLPPPNMKFERSRWNFIRPCSLKSCTKADRLAQRIGFGKSDYHGKDRGDPNVYNCQPLNYEDMEPSVGEEFLAVMRKTMSEEYKSI